MLTPTVRVLAAIIASLMLLGGLVTVGILGITGLWATVVGAAILIALVVERNRYRSEAADRSFERVGPGGGEPSASLEPRFRRSAETFVDPTTNRRMRVFVDGSTGERRYVAEERFATDEGRSAARRSPGAGNRPCYPRRPERPVQIAPAGRPPAPR